MNIKSNFKKIIILVLVTILISSNTLHAAKFKWTKIITSEDDDEFYDLTLKDRGMAILSRCPQKCI